jgi:hypothetical protein
MTLTKFLETLCTEPLEILDCINDNARSAPAATTTDNPSTTNSPKCSRTRRRGRGTNRRKRTCKQEAVHKVDNRWGSDLQQHLLEDSKMTTSMTTQSQQKPTHGHHGHQQQDRHNQGDTELHMPTRLVSFEFTSDMIQSIYAG